MQALNAGVVIAIVRRYRGYETSPRTATQTLCLVYILLNGVFLQQLSGKRINTRLRDFFSYAFKKPSCLLAILLSVFSSPPISFKFLSFSSMAPKRRSTLLIVHGSNAILVPTERHTWSAHPILKDYF